jgi:hypothetical protein
MPEPSAKLEIRPAWRRRDPDLARDALGFWRRFDLLPRGAMIEERLKGLCAVAYKAGEVAAVSCAFLELNAQLRARLAMYRCAIAPQHRRSVVLGEITEASRLILLDWARAHPGEQVKGMGTVTETPLNMLGAPIWRHKDLRLVLVGWTSEGYPIRVAWFPGVRVEPGAPLPVE